MNGRNGLYLDADLQGLMPVGPNLATFAWAKGSWLSFSGQTVDLDYTTLFAGTTNELPPVNAPAGSTIFGSHPGSASSSEGSFHRNFYAIGVGLDFTF